MKTLKTYIPCVILSILLVFSLLGTSAAVTIKIISGKNFFIGIAEKNNVVSSIQTQLEKHFKDEYNETGIPAEIFTDSFTDEYIDSVVKMNIDSGFEALSGKAYSNTTIPNNRLEESIETFFSDYADSIGYEKDDNYYEKLQNTIDSAYDTLNDYCDVYKFGTMNNAGILSKLEKVYMNINLILAVTIISVLVLVVLMAIVCRKYLMSILYWIGSSSIVAGIIGLIPSAYLYALRFFDSFTIKQPQIFASFTGIMYKTTSIFIIAQVAKLLFGLLLIIAFIIFSKRKKSNSN